MKLRAGLKTTEFWIGVFLAVIGVVQRWVWPEDPIPNESFVAVLTWVGARFGEKALSDLVIKRPWQTTEFWVAIAFAIARFALPDIPDAVLYMAQTYIVGRPIVKATEGFGLNLLGGARGRAGGPTPTREP